MRLIVSACVAAGTTAGDERRRGGKGTKGKKGERKEALPFETRLKKAGRAGPVVPQ